MYWPLGRAVWVALLGALGENPLGPQVVGLLLHWVNSLLVLGVARRLASGSTGLAVTAGLLFALSPLQTETLAWKCCLWSKELAFTLPVLALGLHFVMEGPRRARATAALGGYVLLLGLFIEG